MSNNENKMTGEIIKIMDIKTFASGFQKREFVIRTDADKYPQEIIFELLKDNVTAINGMSEGDEASVAYDIRGREYNGRWFNSLVAWGVRAVDGAGSASAPSDSTPPDDERIPF